MIIPSAWCGSDVRKETNDSPQIFNNFLKIICLGDSVGPIAHLHAAIGTTSVLLHFRVCICIPKRKFI